MRDKVTVNRFTDAGTRCFDGLAIPYILFETLADSVLRPHKERPFLPSRAKLPGDHSRTSFMLPPSRGRCKETRIAQCLKDAWRKNHRQTISPISIVIQNAIWAIILEKIYGIGFVRWQFKIASSDMTYHYLVHTVSNNCNGKKLSNKIA